MVSQSNESEKQLSELKQERDEPEEAKGISDYLTNLVQSEDAEASNKKREDDEDEQNFSISEIFVCQICFIQYDDGASSLNSSQSNKPLLIPCGHTICLKCLNHIQYQNRNTQGKKMIKCPFDKSAHPVSGPLDKCFPTNYSIIKGLTAFNQKNKFANTYRRFCQQKGHTSESLNFYCNTH